MLPENIKPLNFETWDQESWEAYIKRVGVPEEEGIRQFYRQVVYDHFNHHNEHYPDFEISNYTYKIIFQTVLFVKIK